MKEQKQARSQGREKWRGNGWDGAFFSGSFEGSTAFSPGGLEKRPGKKCGTGPDLAAGE
ncbi:hypothetical protein GCWU000341_00120 [Oribacterium sp. oral taxon 078 str. F0262]|nr:hypothetical protein GCWU000341_00120 [Oribacterium sp. oral taxon 078 str. F0262]